MTSLSDFVEIVIGIDTHAETHTAAVVHAVTGEVLETHTVEATPSGYQELVDLADRRSPARVWAIEGAGAYGAGLRRYLSNVQEVTYEVDRPDRSARRNGAKTDPIDAIRAARELLATPHPATPRTGTDRELLAYLLTTRRMLVSSAADLQRQLFAATITAPEQLREYLRGYKADALVRRAATMRPVARSWDEHTKAIATLMRDTARRCQQLHTDADTYEKQIKTIVQSWRPDLLDMSGVGPISAATILCSWSHPGRIRNAAAFAMLAGTAPIPANSGQVTTRYRLNRHGDRQLNYAFHTIAVSRIRYDARTKAYVAKRTADGKNPKEIRRCLKNYIARETYRLLEHPAPTLDTP